MKKKVLIFLSVILVIILISYFGFLLVNKFEIFTDENNADTNIINNEDLIFVTVEGITEEKVVDGISFLNANLSVNENISTFSVSTHNYNDFDINAKKIEIIFKNDGNNIVESTDYLLDDTFINNTSLFIIVTLDIDLSNVTLVEYKIIYE